MTFPTIQSRSGNATSATVTSHTVTLPSTVNAGELLVILFHVSGAPTITWDNSTAGTWTNLASRVYSTNNTSEIWYKVASGSEGSAALSITTSTSQHSAHIIYRISGHGSALETSAASVQGLAAPDPPATTPSWGADDTLWLALIGYSGTPTVTATPTNYANTTTYNGTGASRQSVTGTDRTLNATTDNPSAYTISVTNPSIAWTVAIKPAASGLTISSVTPSSFDSGITGVVIAGSGFGSSQGSSTVKIGSQSQTVTAWSNTSITFTSARGSNSMGSNQLTVTVV